MKCIEATRLASEALERPLTLGEKIPFRVHLAICSGCRRFTAQVGVLRVAARRLAAGELPADADSPGTGPSTD